MNTFGNIFRLTSFGESHGAAMGGIIDGIPPLMVIDMQELRAKVASRRPGTSPSVTTRKESDRVEFLSGLLSCNANGEERAPYSDDATFAITLGTPIGFITRNTDSRPEDYSRMADTYRPSHADFTWEKRYGIRDHRGGGRASGRETFSRVVAGAFAMQLLHQKGVSISAKISMLGNCPTPTPEETEQIISRLRASHDSIGGEISCTITGLPAGIGEPTFGKLHQLLGGAMLSIGGVKGVEFGMGFEGCRRLGSEMADQMESSPHGVPRFLSNHSGGVQGGISNGQPIEMRIAVKPTPTISRPLKTIRTDGTPAILEATGRHDPSILLRALPVVEAMAAITILDLMLMRSVSF